MVAAYIVGGIFILFIAYKIGRRGGRKNKGVGGAIVDYVRNPLDDGTSNVP